MPRAYIVHGWDGSPDEPQLRWLRDRLEESGWEVAMPAMPDPAVPRIGPWVTKLNQEIRPGEDVTLIGHSIGCQAILRYVAALPAESRVGRMVLVAPWMELDEETVREEGAEVREIARPWTETPIDFGAVKVRCASVTAIFSDDDPYVPLSQEQVFKDALGATTVIEHGKGHFTESDGVDAFSSALTAVLGS